LDELEAALRRGPLAARVEEVGRMPTDPSADRSSFDVEG
jgi:hypothetical protein